MKEQTGTPPACMSEELQRLRAEEQEKQLKLEESHREEVERLRAHYQQQATETEERYLTELLMLQQQLQDVTGTQRTHSRWWVPILKICTFGIAILVLVWSFQTLTEKHKPIIFLHTYIFNEHFSVDSVMLQMLRWCNLPYSLICCWKKAHTRHNLVQHIGKKNQNDILTTANKRKKYCVVWCATHFSDIIKCVISLHILLRFDENIKGN